MLFPTHCLTLALTFFPIFLLHTTPTTALNTNFTLLNLTHTPTSATAPHIHNGSIRFDLPATTDYSSHTCSHTFITPGELKAAGGPFPCSDEWQDMLYYWREKDDERKESDDHDNGDEQGSGSEIGTTVELNVWFAYIDCSGPTTGGAVSESGTLTLPPPSRVDSEEGELSRAWDVVYVPVQTASSSAFGPGQYEELCLHRR